MKKQYYFLACALPVLKINGKLDISFTEVKDMLDLNLSEDDLTVVNQFLQFIDLLNLRLLWLDRPLDLRGTLNRKELDKAQETGEGLPQYVSDFLTRFESTEDRLHNFAYLLTQFFAQTYSGFLKRYFQFERNWRLVVSAIRAKKLGRDITQELQYEDFQDPLVAYILAQKDMENFEPPEDFSGLKDLFSKYTDPLELHKAFLEYRFSKVGEMVENESFTIDLIIGYLAQLLIVEDWAKLNKTQGKEIVDSLT